MNISTAQIKAMAENYTVAQLKDKLREALAKLESGSVITQANSGSGTGYTRTIIMNPAEAVELYQMALDYKMGCDESRIQVERFIIGG
jgi:formate-dependent phosphoribosylglycinamide formyltransferase (GAR transformylase)